MKFIKTKSVMTPVPLGVLLLIFFVLSCGKGFDKEDKEEDQEEEDIEQQYNIDFRPLNQKVGRYHGWGGLAILENQFWARVKIQGPFTEDAHAQYIHTGKRCPSMSDDTNRDGYLDFMEVSEVSGQVLIPLDGNLNSQLKGLNEFPKMKQNNMYYYSESSNYSWLLEDLEKPDIYTTDMVTKLEVGEELNLDSRVVLIYGVSLTRRLPSTVDTFDGYPAQATLPIACGEIRNGASTEFN